MRFFRMLREHLHISAKTVIYGEMLVLSLLCLSIFLFKTDPGQACLLYTSRFFSLMPSIPFNALDTEAMNTPASLAISLIITCFILGLLPISPF